MTGICLANFSYKQPRILETYPPPQIKHFLQGISPAVWVLSTCIIGLALAVVVTLAKEGKTLN